MEVLKQKCNFIMKRGHNKGNECGNTVKKGESNRCYKHANVVDKLTFPKEKKEKVPKEKKEPKEKREKVVVEKKPKHRISNMSSFSVVEDVIPPITKIEDDEIKVEVKTRKPRVKKDDKKIIEINIQK